MGSCDSRLLHTPGVALPYEQGGCHPEDFDPPASSSSPGAAKISFAVRLRASSAPGTQGPVERADRRGGRDETAQPVFRLPEDRRATFQRLRHRPKQGCRPAHSASALSTSTGWRHSHVARGYRVCQGPLVERRSLPRRINPAQELLDLGGYGRLHAGSLVLVSRQPISTASGSAGCSIARSPEQLCPGTFLPITIPCSAFSAGARTFGCWTSRRSKPSQVLPVRMCSSND